MLAANGNAIITRHDNPLTHQIERLDFKWKGGNVSRISFEVLHDFQPEIVKFKRYPPQVGDTIWLGPYNLKVAEIDLFGYRDDALVVRVDSLAGWLRYAWHRTCKTLDFIYRRLIITAVVWNCARRNEGVMPTWRDLYFIEHVRRLIKR